MENAEATKVSVKVGGWDPDGTFTGQVIRFSGEEVGFYRQLHGQFSSGDDRGTDYRLYKTPDGKYRVHIDTWSRWQGEESYAQLLPNNAEEDMFHPDDPEYGHPVKYGTYTEEEARSRHPQIFAAIGDPNVIDLDDE